MLLLVGLVDSCGEGLGIIAVGPDAFAFFRHYNGGAGVLATREDAPCRNLGILQKHQGYHAVVFGGFRIIEDASDLL